MNTESMQSMVYRLREDENIEHDEELDNLIDNLVDAIITGQLTIDQVQQMIGNTTDIDETSVSGGSMGYLPSLHKKDHSINEGYSSFKKMAMHRSKSQQYSEGIKIVRKNLKNISKMTEYLVRLKEELNQDESIKESKLIQKGIFEIENCIKEIFINYKKIK